MLCCRQRVDRVYVCELPSDCVLDLGPCRRRGRRGRPMRMVGDRFVADAGGEDRDSCHGGDLERESAAEAREPSGRGAATEEAGERRGQRHREHRPECRALGANLAGDRRALGAGAEVRAEPSFVCAFERPVELS
jgi:hypothetical protein